jgi:hypothetical protein
MALRLLEFHLVPLSKAEILVEKRLVMSMRSEKSGQLPDVKAAFAMCMADSWPHRSCPFLNTSRDLCKTFPLSFLLAPTTANVVRLRKIESNPDLA